MGFFVDVSGRTLVSLAGHESLDLLQRISTNNVVQLKAYGSVQTVLTNEKGRIVDVVSVIDNGQGKLLVAGHSTDTESLRHWIEKYVIMEDIKIEDLTSDSFNVVLYRLELQNEDPAILDLPSGCHAFVEVMGGVRFERIVGGKALQSVVAELLSGFGFSESSKEDFEQFRIARGVPGFPNELSSSYNPLEAGLGSLVSWTKGCYVGQEVIARLDTYKKLQKTLVRMDLAEMPDSLPQIFFDQAGEAGTITSAIRASSTGENRGLGYLKTSIESLDGPFFFQREDREVNVSVVDDAA